MSARYARAGYVPDTTYVQFRSVKSARGGEGPDGIVDWNTGKSPIARYLTYVIKYDEAVSEPGVGMVVRCNIPRGTLVRDALVRLDTAFSGTGCSAVDIGDSNDSDGYAVDLDFTTSTASGPVWFRDANAAYVNRASDISQGTSGAQFYKDGGVVTVVLATADDMTAGLALLFLETISYHEDQGAEALSTTI